MSKDTTERLAAIQKILLIGHLLCVGLLLQSCGGDDGGNDKQAVPASQVYTISGALRTPTGHAVDSDVNDTLATFLANDSSELAQTIANPVTLGGYVNRPGSGPRGRSYDQGDVVDWFRVTLAAGQVINLFVAEDGFSNDLDLALFDADGHLVEVSASQSRFESLIVPETGNYFVVVEAFRGASNYVLTTGQHGAGSANGFTLDADFVPGEIIVRFHETSDANARARTADLGLLARAGASGRNSLYTITAGATAAARAAAGDHAIALIRSADPAVQHKLDTLQVAKRMALRGDVAAATLNYWRQAHFIPNDARYPQQWHYPLIGLPRAWDIAIGDGVIVAVVDTGVLLAHPDLQGQLVAGYDFVSDPLRSLDGDGIDPNPDDSGDKIRFMGSSSFHGTHMAGTIAAATNNEIGVAGIAFTARVMPLRALGRKARGTDYDIEQAIRFAAGLANDSGTVPEQKAHVINLSLGGLTPSITFERMLQQVREAGLVVVASAGNEHSSEPSFPAAYPGVITVSAVDINRQLAPYSNFGPIIDIAAPGGDKSRDNNGDGFPDGILSTIAEDSSGMLTAGYQFYEGTSMAVPHVAAVIALMRSVNPDLSPEDVDELLANGAMTDDLGEPGRDDSFGYGLINAFKAVTAAANDTGVSAPLPIPPALIISPDSLNFGANLSSITLHVGNSGGGILTVNPPDENSGGWLSITPQTDANGLGDYIVMVNRDTLPAGIYPARITFTSSAGSAVIHVVVQVAPQVVESSDIGLVYVFLIDSARNQVVAKTSARRQTDGSYTYSITDIAAGSYDIFAGTDSDNQGDVCGAGEACGAYPNLNQPVALELNGNRHNIDFTSGFMSTLIDFNPAVANQIYPEAMQKESIVNSRRPTR